MVFFAGCMYLVARGISDLHLSPSIPIIDICIESLRLACKLALAMLAHAWKMFRLNRKTSLSLVYALRRPITRLVSVIDQFSIYIVAVMIACSMVHHHANGILPFIIYRLEEPQVEQLLMPLSYALSICSAERPGIRFKWRVPSPVSWILRWGYRHAFWFTVIHAHISRGRRSGPGRNLHTGSNSQCLSFTGRMLACDELRRARDFNANVMPTLHYKSPGIVRKEMSSYGLESYLWHSGHACPDPNKSTSTDLEDLGWNRFAQHAADNMQLGHCLVSCKEAMHHAARVNCTDSNVCINRC